MHYVWFSQFLSHFHRTMHCLPQRLNSTLFEKFSSRPARKGSAAWEKISNNVDFSLWGNRATAQNTFFDIFMWDQNHENHTYLVLVGSTRFQNTIILITITVPKIIPMINICRSLRWCSTSSMLCLWTTQSPSGIWCGRKLWPENLQSLLRRTNEDHERRKSRRTIYQNMSRWCQKLLWSHRILRPPG